MPSAAVNLAYPRYFDELSAAMDMLAQNPKTIFMGQGVGPSGGTTMSQTFADIPEAQRLEMPVAEDMQMGMAIGMSLAGFLPVCVFPRWNFLLCAANQLVNHLDRLEQYSGGGYRPKVIIRTAAPSTFPFNPGPQHSDDFTRAFSYMLGHVEIVRLGNAEYICESYRKAMESDRSTLLVEYTDRYKNERDNVRSS